jgi:hypothetical protein
MPNTVAYCVHGLRDTEKSDDIIDPKMIPDSIEYQKLLTQILK